jgi:U3 small nucleolar RNA-associated protein 15
VSSIDFSPQYPYDYAVTASTRVLIYDAATRRQRTTLSRFKDRAYSGTFRGDGRLLVAGGESGIVQVCLLRSLAMHGVLGRRACSCCETWVQWLGHERTGGLSTCVQVFDPYSQTLLRQLKGHAQPVHAARFGQSKMHVLSGGDDATVQPL